MRAANLTRQLLAFARKQLIEPKVLDLNDLILDMNKLLRRVIGENIELISLPEPDLRRVRVDPGQIEQVLVNLAVNARDAMPRGGMLTIETANTTLGTGAIQHAGDDRGAVCAAGGERHRHRYDRRGTAASVRAVLHHQAAWARHRPGPGHLLRHCQAARRYIWPYSEVGQGTTIKISLPQVEGRPRRARAPTQADQPH